jgi:polyferredoxin
MGFAFFAPLFPWQLQLLMLGKIPAANLPMVLLVSTVVILSSLLVGRVFCGNICLPGALQELAYPAPWEKVKMSSSIATKVRCGAFSIMVVLSVALSFSPTKVLGLQDLFELVLGRGLVIFLVIPLVSTVVNRSFCRLICPFGAISSLLDGRSWFGMRRNENCVECGRCEKVCPPHMIKEGRGARNATCAAGA